MSRIRLLTGVNNGVRVPLWETTDRQVMVGQSSRFFEPTLQQQNDHLAGRHGTLLTVEAHYVHDHRDYLQSSWARGGKINWIYGGLSHAVDLLALYLRNISEVTAYGMTSPAAADLGLTSPDTIHAIFRTADGVVARVSGAYGGVTFGRAGTDLIQCTVPGQKGVLLAEYPSLRYTWNWENGREEVRTNWEAFDYYFRFEVWSHHAGEFQNYMEYFVRCLSEDRAPEPSLISGIRTVAVMEAIERSIEKGIPQKPNLLLADAGLGELAVPNTIERS